MVPAGDGLGPLCYVGPAEQEHCNQTHLGGGSDRDASEQTERLPANPGFPLQVEAAPSGQLQDVATTPYGLQHHPEWSGEDGDKSRL